jgi:hypothetical protein
VIQAHIVECDLRTAAWIRKTDSHVDGAPGIGGCGIDVGLGDHVIPDQLGPLALDGAARSTAHIEPARTFGGGVDPCPIGQIQPHAHVGTAGIVAAIRRPRGYRQSVACRQGRPGERGVLMEDRVGEGRGGDRVTHPILIPRFRTCDSGVVRDPAQKCLVLDVGAGSTASGKQWSPGPRGRDRRDHPVVGHVVRFEAAVGDGDRGRANR